MQSKPVFNLFSRYRVLFLIGAVLVLASACAGPSFFSNGQATTVEAQPTQTVDELDLDPQSTEDVEATPESESEIFNDAGVIEAISTKSITINGDEYTLDENSEVEADLAKGDLVDFEAQAQPDGTWVLLWAERVEDESQSSDDPINDDACYDDEGYYICEGCYDAQGNNLCEKDECYDEEGYYICADQASPDAESNDSSASDWEEEDGTPLVIYDVKGNNLTNPQPAANANGYEKYQKDTARQKEIWSQFACMIPAENRDFVSEFIIFTDDEENTLAYVEQSSEEADRWNLGVDIIDAKDAEELTGSLIHEYGHLLTLNAEQIPPDLDVYNNPDSDAVYEKAENACPTFFAWYGCSKPDSYINLFYDAYWVDIYDEWSKIDEMQDGDEDVYYEGLEAFYNKYSDQFANVDAVTDISEDLAEAWTLFIMEPKPTGNSIADQKVLFFYQFPELLQLREHINTNLTCK